MQDKKATTNIYYVTPRKDKSGKKIGWEVKKGNAAKVTKVLASKQEAIDYIKPIAENSGCTIMIRKIDGSHDKTIKTS
ncbi:MAG: DUF2188 domain-containing protein [Metamycoplasmataceae bacterium]